MEKRTNCRNVYKELRNAMTSEEVRDKSKQVCDRIITSSWYQNAEIIFGYYPLGNEVDILFILEHALKTGKRVALPKTELNKQMDFYEVKSLKDDVMEGAFHIMEPVAVKGKCKIMTDADSKKAIVLTPGVAFDREGNRYGYGKGFYDRYFARFPELYRVGVAYEMQITDDVLELFETDKPMHIIITEQEEIKR